jgi:1-aminocyclopropane-1-carboxylate deaminase
MATTTDNKTVPLPQPFNTIPRVELLFPFPSPIEPLQRLSTHLSHSQNSPSSLGQIFIKRDDMNSGLSGGGGNKLRKLEYVLADAVAQGADTLVTVGGVQSNHMRQTAAAGSRVGMQVRSDICFLCSAHEVEEGDVEFTWAGIDGH